MRENPGEASGNRPPHPGFLMATATPDYTLEQSSSGNAVSGRGSRVQRCPLMIRSCVTRGSCLTASLRVALACRMDASFRRGGRYARSVTVELDGRCWKPVPGATATSEEFVAAWSLIREIHQQCLWSPWVMQDRAKEYDAAWKACGQWTSAEPGSPARTAEDYEAEADRRMAEADARFLAEQAQAEKDHTERAEHYDPGRAQARLAMLEEQAILAEMIRQRDELLSAGRSRLAGDEDSRKLLASLERSIAVKTKDVEGLAAVVGDPEAVPDAGDWLPAERREMALVLFKSRRATEVRDLRARVTDSQAKLKSLTRKSERAELREALREDKARLA
jgi:hypothetical protein